MNKNVVKMLEEAYLSISSKKEKNNTPIDVGPMEEPAPGIDMNLKDREQESDNVSGLDKEAVGIPVITANMEDDNKGCGCEGAECDCNSNFDLEQEDEEDQMSIDNLNSIRESINKIGAFCAKGGHLEGWAQQKLAIAMDNLAEVSRRCY
jgi:hypothetical protein